MCELTLDALGYRPREAALARRIHDLTHTPAQRAAAQSPILARARAPHAQAAPHPKQEPTP